MPETVSFPFVSARNETVSGGNEIVGEGVETDETEDDFVNTVNTENNFVNTVFTNISLVTSEGTIMIQTSEGDKPTKEFFKWLVTTWNRRPKRNMALVEMRRDELFSYIGLNPTREALDWIISHDEIVGDDCYEAALARVRAHAESIENSNSSRGGMSWTVAGGESFLNAG